MGRPPIHARAMTGAERQAAYMERLLRGKTAPPPGAGGSQDAPRAKAKARPKTKGQPKEKASVAGGADPFKQTLESQNRYLIGELNRLKQSIERRAKAPPPEPGSEAERTIKGLRTQVRNLKAELAHLTSEDDVSLFRSNRVTGAMSFATYTKIAKALHTDHEPTKAERAAAMSALNAWKADQKKAKAAG